MDHIAASRKHAIAEAAGTLSDDEEFAALRTEDNGADVGHNGCV